MVALLIFGMLSAAAVSLLSFSVRSQALAETRLDELADLRRAGALIGGDLAQAAARLHRGAAGDRRPAFVGGPGGAGPALAFVRRGWENVDGGPRASLQRVEYRLSGGRLERVSWPRVDGAAPDPPMTLIEGVTRLELRYRDREGEWRRDWAPTDPFAIPAAVEMIVERGGEPPVRQLFLSGSGA